MKTFLRFFLALVVLCTASLAAAQTQPPPKPGFLVVHSNKVLMKDLARANALQDSLFKPVLDQFVKDGKLLAWGQTTHAWGDEWNFNFYYATESHRTFLDFLSEFSARMNKQSPGWGGVLTALIVEHKDNMYTFRYAAPLNGTPRFLVFHQNKVAMKDLARANELQDSLFKPVFDELVEEGKLVSWGQVNHAWGDEWNFNFYYYAASHRAFLDAFDEAFARINKRTPDWAKDIIPLLQEHKDNMYGIRYRMP